MTGMSVHKKESGRVWSKQGVRQTTGCHINHNMEEYTETDANPRQKIWNCFHPGFEAAMMMMIYLSSRERVKLNENEIAGLLFNFIQSSILYTLSSIYLHYALWYITIYSKLVENELTLGLTLKSPGYIKRESLVFSSRWHRVNIIYRLILVLCGKDSLTSYRSQPDPLLSCMTAIYFNLV